ncbi:MAG: hypothetical protein LBT40_08095, partial [Deltaproteobacteria bacterium]|nr:hypothetical protein [Deltaproteobacteria bacterium]
MPRKALKGLGRHPDGDNREAETGGQDCGRRNGTVGTRVRKARGAGGPGRTAEGPERLMTTPLPGLAVADGEAGQDLESHCCSGRHRGREGPGRTERPGRTWKATAGLGTAPGRGGARADGEAGRTSQATAGLGTAPGPGPGGAWADGEATGPRNTAGLETAPGSGSGREGPGRTERPDRTAKATAGLGTAPGPGGARADGEAGQDRESHCWARDGTGAGAGAGWGPGGRRGR